MAHGSALAIEFPNSLTAPKTRSAVAALIFVRTTTSGPRNFCWHRTTRGGRSRGRKNIEAFYKGLDTLDVRYERIRAPYGAHHLNALYFPGAEGSGKRPLIVICGGFDSTLEELYFVLVPAALERGYSVLAYEGPGQASIIREQGIPFTHEWKSRRELF
jgi:hypothetical protein